MIAGAPPSARTPERRHGKRRASWNMMRVSSHSPATPRPYVPGCSRIASLMEQKITPTSASWGASS